VNQPRAKLSQHRLRFTRRCDAELVREELLALIVRAYGLRPIAARRQRMHQMLPAGFAKGLELDDVAGKLRRERVLRVR